MDGVGLSPPCDLDSGNPCRNDGVDLLSTTNANIALNKGPSRILIEHSDFKNSRFMQNISSDF
jgi:hypothetical protein